MNWKTVATELKSSALMFDAIAKGPYSDAKKQEAEIIGQILYALARALEKGAK